MEPMGRVIVSIVVPFWGYVFRILSIKLVTPKKELQWRLQVGLRVTLCFPDLRKSLN